MRWFINTCAQLRPEKVGMPYQAITYGTLSRAHCAHAAHSVAFTLCLAMHCLALRPVFDVSRSEAFYAAHEQAPGNAQVMSTLKAGLQGCRVLHSRTPADVVTHLVLQNIEPW